MSDNGTMVKAAPQQQQQTAAQLLASPQFQQQMAMALPGHMTAERMARVALTQLRKVPKLGQCTTASVAACVLQAAAFGLEPDGRRAHLIPRENRKAGIVECTLIIDYKGLVELAIRNGDLASIHADVVCENDDFEYDLGEIKKHRIDLRKPRGAVYAVYCRIVRKDGASQAVVMSREEVEAVRSRSQSRGDGPWVTDWNEMAKKTAFRRLTKWLVLSPEIRDAVEHDDDHDVQPTQVVASGTGMSRLAGLVAATSEPEPPAIGEHVCEACDIIAQCQTPDQVRQTLDAIGRSGQFSAEDRAIINETGERRLAEMEQVK